MTACKFTSRKFCAIFCTFVRFSGIYKLSRGTANNNKFACAFSEVSDQSVHPRSLIRAFPGILWVDKVPKDLQTVSEDSGQTARIGRLISVFTRRTCSLVKNAVSRLICKFCDAHLRRNRAFVSSQRAHDVNTTSPQRRCNVMTLHRR